jgi:hypothetical protein
MHIQHETNMESKKILIETRDKPAIKKATTIKVPGAFSRKGVGPLIAPSATLHKNISIKRRMQISKQNHVKNIRRASLYLNNYFIDDNQVQKIKTSSHIVKKEWNSRTSIIRNSPQVFLNSTSPVSIGNSSNKRKGNVTRKKRKKSLTKRKERYHYGFLNVQASREQSTAIAQRIKSVTDQNLIRHQRIDDIKQKINAMKEQLDQNEIYSKKMLNTINHVSKRLLQGNKLPSPTQENQIGALSQVMHINKFNSEEEMISKNENELCEPDIALPLPPM